LHFCEEIIVEYATAPFQEGYDYQISDGVEVAVNAIPYLMELLPNAESDLTLILLLILFDPHPLGYYKRICDYSIESIKRKLWDSSADKVKHILFAFLKFKSIYNSIVNEFREASMNENRRPRFSQSQLITELLKRKGAEIDRFLKSPIQSEGLSISEYSIDDLEIAFQLVPDETKEESLKNLVLNFNPVFAKALFHKNRDIDHLLRIRVFRKYASFILNCDTKIINDFTKDFVDEFNFNEEVARFFQEIISTEDILQKYDQFWSVWQCFYSNVTNRNKHSGYYLSEMIHNYLLAWNYWKETAKNWHSLKVREKKFYKNIISDIGHLPCVFDSIVKLLNEIGSEFLDEGIFWISDLVDKNRYNILEGNTTYYMEKLVRKYVYLNRNKVKQDMNTKQKIVNILNFLIENSSVNAYLLREDVI
jgi:hypothetical protein